MVCLRPSTFDDARLVAALIGINLVFDYVCFSIYFRINITSLIVTAARPTILFAVAAVTAGAVVLVATTTTLATLLLMLLLLVFELHLKLFDLMYHVVVLLVAVRPPTLAALAAGIFGGPVGVVEPALVGEVQIFVVRLPLLTVGALSFLVLDLVRLLLLVREAGLLPRNLAILRDVDGAARNLLVLIKQLAIDHRGIRAPFKETRELI